MYFCRLSQDVESYGRCGYDEYVKKMIRSAFCEGMENLLAEMFDAWADLDDDDHRAALPIKRFLQRFEREVISLAHKHDITSGRPKRKRDRVLMYRRIHI